MILPASHRPLTVSSRGKRCYGFQWVGQPFNFCDNCGHPFWKHSHELTIWREGPKAGRQLRRIITVDRAISCYMKWGS